MQKNSKNLKFGANQEKPVLIGANRISYSQSQPEIILIFQTVDALWCEVVCFEKTIFKNTYSNHK